MHLREYLASDGHLSVSAIRARMNELGAAVKDDAQIRQWASSRRPDAANCRYLELATDGKVKRADMRPDDYAAIWPELAATPAKSIKRAKSAPVARAVTVFDHALAGGRQPRSEKARA